jgi:hypothetical protein
MVAAQTLTHGCFAVLAAWFSLQVFIDKFSQVFPDYRERVVSHEAAHLLIGESDGSCTSSHQLYMQQTAAA